MNRHFWWFTLQKYSKSSGVHEVDKKEKMSTWYEKGIPVMEMPFVSTEKTQKKSSKKNEVDIESPVIIHLTNRESRTQVR